MTVIISIAAQLWLIHN